MSFTRRTFIRMSGAATMAAGLFRRGEAAPASAPPYAPDKIESLTIQDVIDLLIDGAGGRRLETTVDTVKTGGPRQPVRGIVVTMFATRDVLEQAVEIGANFVITHEPTFYNHLDEVEWLASDEVYLEKRRFIDEHGLVVFRFHDYWHRYDPDGILLGALKRLGWERYADEEEPAICSIPARPLGVLVRDIKAAMQLDSIRFVGEESMEVRRVALLPGAWGGGTQIGMLGRPDVDVLVCGEINEWEASEYVRDARLTGRRKALVILGHINSEEPGMNWLAQWLAPQLPGVPVVHIPAGDPFRTI